MRTFAYSHECYVYCFSGVALAANYALGQLEKKCTFNSAQGLDTGCLGVFVDDTRAPLIDSRDTSVRDGPTGSGRGMYMKTIK